MSRVFPGDDCFTQFRMHGLLYKYRNICLWEPFGPESPAFKGHSYDVEHTFVASVRKSLCRPQERCRCLYRATLFYPADIVLRRSLYAEFAGLDLNEMYAFMIEGYYVDLKMSASPVAFQYDMAHFHEQAACYIFAKLAYIASVISATFHIPSVFFTIAFLVFVWPSASSV